MGSGDEPRQISFLGGNDWSGKVGINSDSGKPLLTEY